MYRFLCELEQLGLSRSRQSEPGGRAAPSAGGVQRRDAAEGRMNDAVPGRRPSPSSIIPRVPAAAAQYAACPSSSATTPGGSSVGLRDVAAVRRVSFETPRQPVCFLVGIMSRCAAFPRERELRRSVFVDWESLVELGESFPGSYFSSHSEDLCRLVGLARTTRSSEVRRAGRVLSTKGTL
ncbi:hypothetical protein THAOC_24125 [Thalassiosira oceanica]|uniref:Uncharacterized protein n=1 Tax=Thalassiosira oceanica TaxID=159749 RepID=K0RQK9_THAOC|nr:hypothetical protein THAOC_24125 [Thalassiosira oceanica]|eukprot:EJK56058.1 hypothetical protein THAOC_24125 [Thalassiosira oceanica]